MRHKHSDYMHWSKTQSRARFNLATSGVAPFPLRELPMNLEELEINGENSYGYPPLQQAIAAYHGVDPQCGVAAAGCSIANRTPLMVCCVVGVVLLKYAGNLFPLRSEVCGDQQSDEGLRRQRSAMWMDSGAA